MRHSLRVEAIVVLALYAVYEATRGLVVGDGDAAVEHARQVASLERSLHTFVEGNMQSGARLVPGLMSALDVAYLTLHLSVTVVFLLWLYRRRPDPLIRTTYWSAARSHSWDTSSIRLPA